MDCGAEELLLQALEQTPEYVLLNLCPDVLRLAGFVKTSNVADAYGMGVVAVAAILECKDGKYEALREEDILVKA